MADGNHRLKLKSGGNDGHFMPADAASEVNKNATTRKERGQLANGVLRLLRSFPRSPWERPCRRSASVVEPVANAPSSAINRPAVGTYWIHLPRLRSNAAMTVTVILTGPGSTPIASVSSSLPSSSFPCARRAICRARYAY